MCEVWRVKDKGKWIRVIGERYFLVYIGRGDWVIGKFFFKEEVV